MDKTVIEAFQTSFSPSAKVACVNRRKYLAGTAAVVASLIAGCNTSTEDGSTPTSDQSPSTDQYVHYFTLYNYRDSVQTVQLEIINEDGEEIIEEEYEMTPDSAREHVPLSEVPVRAEVRINDRPEEEFVWPNLESCRDQNKAGKPGLRIQIHSDEILYEWPCESVNPTPN